MTDVAMHSHTWNKACTACTWNKELFNSNNNDDGDDDNNNILLSSHNKHT
jgi:hypothetical protein